MMLSEHLNKNHPIHDKLNKLSELKLRDLKKNLNIKKGKELKMSIAHFFFIKHPENPLTSLEKVLLGRQDQNEELNENKNKSNENEQNIENDHIQVQDSSVQIPDDRKIILDMLKQYQLVNVGTGKNQLKKCLYKHLTKNHPIHVRVNEIPNCEIKKMYIELKLKKINRSIPRRKMAIANHFFETTPECPLTSLENFLKNRNFSPLPKSANSKKRTSTYEGTGSKSKKTKTNITSNTEPQNITSNLQIIISSWILSVLYMG